MADLLVALFYLPTRHLHEYGRLLLKLATCFEVVGVTMIFMPGYFIYYYWPLIEDRRLLNRFV